MKRVVEIQGNVSALLEEMLGTESAREEHRAMIAATVEELTPIIGTRPACRALGASPATIYRRRRPPEPRPPQAAADARPGAVEPERAAGARGAALASGSSTSRRRRPRRRCWTRAPTCARPARCTGSSPPTTAACASGAISSPTPPTRSPSCSPSGRTSCGRWDVSKLKGPAKWTWFYLYVILDVFSRFAARRKTAVLFPDFTWPLASGSAMTGA